MSSLVIFHSINGTMHCDDGFGAACIAKMGCSDGEPELYPALYGEEPPWDKIEGRRVYLLDFSYKRDAMLRIGRSAGHLVVLDHHKTAQAELVGLGDELLADGWETDGFGQYLNAPYVVFDMEHSGAFLAWRFFFGNFGEPPDLIKRIEDADLWRFAFDDTKAVQAALRSYPQTPEVWIDLLDRPIEELAAEGLAVRRFIDAKIRELLPNSRIIEVAGYTVQAVACPRFLASELAGELAKRDAAPFAVAYEDGASQRTYSLRSFGDFDVGELAKKFGGGGHKNAAGFQTPLP